MTAIAQKIDRGTAAALSNAGRPARAAAVPSAARLDAALAVLRAIVGTVFVAHGAQKLFVFGLAGVAGAFGEMGIPLAGIVGPAVALVELFGGLALLAGLLTRLAGAGLAVVMLGAMLLAHLPGGFFAPNGIEFALTLFGAAVALALTGPGRFSLDAILLRRRSPDPRPRVPASSQRGDRPDHAAAVGWIFRATAPVRGRVRRRIGFGGAGESASPIHISCSVSEQGQIMIAVTGVTGHLGRLIVEDLLERGVAANEVVGLARNPEKAQPLTARGVEVRRADYSRPETLTAALRGIDRLVLVSSSEVGQRAAHHGNVIDAARAAGIELLVYTSLLGASTSGMQLAEEHRQTEELIRESEIPSVILRNGWYVENYTENLAPALEHEVLLGSAENGRVSPATRADYAAAAAAVATTAGHEGKVYELGGDEAFTLPELAEEVARRSGRPVEYRDLPEQDYVNALVGAGVPDPYARILADSDRGLARGELYTDSGDLRRLIGRPTTPWQEVVARAI